MKYLSLGILLCVAFGSIVFLFANNVTRAQALPANPEHRQLMQEKLGQAQALLESLVTSDFAGMADSARELGRISIEAEWRSDLSPEYGDQSAEFRSAVARLQKAVEEKNQDGATLNFLHMVSVCVQCHKGVSGSSSVASLFEPLQLPRKKTDG